MKIDHGTSAAQIIIGLITALLLNGGLAVGIVLASQAKQEAVSSRVEEAAEPELFQCRYFEAGRLHQIEVEAEGWQEAEVEVCGASLHDVRLPPLLYRGQLALGVSRDEEPLLKAQRESCSCNQGETVPILQDVGIVQAPKLGTKPKQTALPRISNRAPKAEHNAVNPEAEPKKDEKPKKSEKPEKKSRDVDVDKLLGTVEDFDPNRPTNTDEAVGTEWGSASGSGEGKGPVFLQKVKAKLDNTMKAPASIPKSELRKLKAKLWIQVGSNGAVWDWKFKRKSGNAAFDAMIERTIERFAVGGSARFPSPPDAWMMKKIPITVDGAQVR